MNWDNQNQNQWGQAQNNDWGQAQTQASPWDGFEQIETRPARNEWVPAGLNTVAKVVSLKTVKSQKNIGQMVFVATISIENEGGEVHYDWVAKLNERAYLSNVKSLVCALNPDAPPSSFGSAAMDHICGPEQPCAGMKVRIRTEEITTSRGNPFTKVYWSPA